MRRFRNLIGVLVFIAAMGAIWMVYFSPMAEARALFEQTIGRLNAAVASGKREEVTAIFQQHLSSYSRVKIEAHYESMGAAVGGSPFVMEYDKPGFLAFVNDLMGRFQTYGMETKPGSFHYDWALSEAAVTTNSLGWADRAGGFGAMGVPARYGAEAPCSAQLTFLPADGGKRVQIDRAECVFKIRILPKVDPESLQKIKERWREYQKP